MTQSELLQFQLEFAIAHNYDTKLKLTDYPGYWILIIEEMLEQVEIKSILSNLHLNSHYLARYKAMYGLAVRKAMRICDDEPPEHPNCKASTALLEQDRPAPRYHLEEEEEDHE